MVKNKKMSIQAKASIAYSLASLFSKGVSIIMKLVLGQHMHHGIQFYIQLLRCLCVQAH